MFGRSKSNGSSPIKGRVSDNRLCKILEIPKSTLVDWKNSFTYKRELYWLLKTMSPTELEEKKQEGLLYRNLR